MERHIQRVVINNKYRGIKSERRKKNARAEARKAAARTVTIQLQIKSGEKTERKRGQVK